MCRVKLNAIQVLVCEKERLLGDPVTLAPRDSIVEISYASPCSTSREKSKKEKKRKAKRKQKDLIFN